MTKRPINRTRFYVLLGLLAALVLMAWYLGDQTPVAGGRALALGLPTG